MNDNAQSMVCPKCGNVSVSTEACDSCGALLSRIAERGPDSYLQNRSYRSAGLTDPDIFDVPARRPPWIMIVAGALILGIIASSVWFYLSQTAQRKHAPGTAAPTPIRSHSQPVTTSSQTAMFHQTVKTTATSEQTRVQTPSPHAQTPSTETAKAMSGLLGQLAGSIQKLGEPAATPARSPKALQPSNTEVDLGDTRPSRTPKETADAIPTPAATIAPTQDPDASIDLDEEMFRGSAARARGAIGAATFRGSAIRTKGSSTGEKGLSAPAPPPSSEANNGGGGVREIGSASFSNEVVAHPGCPVLAAFVATWSTPANEVSSRLDQLSSEFGTRLKIVKLNYDNSGDVIRRCNIRTCPTVLIYKSGQEVGRFSGPTPYERLKAGVLQVM